MDLNPAQVRAISHVGHVLVSACPGSGKTTVLGQRAAQLLRANATNRIGAVTFTRDAAGELRSRIERYASRSTDTRLVTGTFHSLALEQLQAKRKGRLRVLSDNEQRHYVRQAADLVNPKLSLDVALAAVQEFKSWLHPPAIPAHCDDERLLVYQAYEKLRTGLNVVDFNDLLLMAVHGMRAANVEPLRVTHLLVDEFQDADQVQIEWVRCHVDAGVSVTVVGDDDQSIYGFRNARGYAGMVQFQAFAGATHIPLDTTYRCAPEIVRAASLLIAHNENRVLKDLRTQNRRAGEVRVESASTASAEAAQVADYITLAADQQWAILARSNWDLDVIESELAGRELPYSRPSGTSFWDRAGPHAFLSAVKAVAEYDASSICIVLAAVGVGPDTREGIQKILGCARAGGRRLVDGAVDLERDMPFLSAQDRHVVVDLRDRIAEWARLATSRREELAIYGISDWLAANVSKRLRNTDFGMCSRAIARIKGTLGNRLFAIRNAVSQDSDARLTLLTMHASKGQEFDRVWIIGVDDGNMPHQESTVEEERRLLYVAMTRARVELVLSHRLRDERQKKHPSPFLAEAGLEVRPVGLAASPVRD